MKGPPMRNRMTTYFLTACLLATLFIGPGCGGEGAIPDPNLSMDELMKYFENRPIVRCDVPGWVFLGLSMTGWNFLYATGFAAFTFYHVIKGYLDARKKNQGAA